MKESVFDHYTEFIGFSEEVQKMDDSMEQLKKNLTRTFKLLDNLKVSVGFDAKTVGYVFNGGRGGRGD